ncbi:MAG: glycosyltransferase family 39 protein [Candidatus Omnitrophica bacterium]|nr:glycosyltransferase family 39 protein [Candidatus Omnitrophota bacterium]
MEKIITYRPLFPLMMTASFSIFGYSVKSAFYVVRLFYVLNIMLIYFLGSKMFNKATGLTCSLLVFTSFVVNRCASYLLLDNIVPFFILGYIFLIYLAFKNKNYIYFALAGLALSLAILLKGVIAVMFIPLPVCLLCFKSYRSVKTAKGTALFFMFSAVLLSPWLYKVFAGKESLEILVGPLVNLNEIKKFGIITPNRLTWSTGGILAEQLRIASNFINRYIIRQLAIWPLVFFGIAYSFFGAVFRKKLSDRIFLMAVILFLPVVYITAKANSRLGQFLTLYFLFYLAIANFLINFPTEFLKAKNRILNISVFFLVLACVLMQVFVGATAKKNFLSLIFGVKVRGVYEFSFWKSDFKLDGWTSKTVRESSEWIEENIVPGTAILCQKYALNAIYFFTQGKYELLEIKNVEISEFKNKYERRYEEPLFIWPSREWLEGQFESDLLKQINDGRIGYLVVTQKRNFLNLYVENNPKFSLLKSFSKGEIKIYKATKYPVTPIGGNLIGFEYGVYKYFRQLYLNSKRKYDLQKENFEVILGWPDSEIKKFFSIIEEGRKREFWRNYQKVYEWKVY